MSFVSLKPLTSNSDWHLTSPYSVIPEYSHKYKRETSFAVNAMLNLSNRS